MCYSDDTRNQLTLTILCSKSTTKMKKILTINRFFPGNYDLRFVEQCSEVTFIREKRRASRALGTPPVTNGGGGGVSSNSAESGENSGASSLSNVFVRFGRRPSRLLEQRYSTLA